MDGFPMDHEQALSFTRLIGTPDTVIHLYVNADVMKSRLQARGNFDDSDDSIEKRIKNYNEKTKPLIEKWNAIKIDAEKPTPEVFANLMTALEKENALKLCETVQMA